MHSSPIDLVANAPKRQKATPAESEPDGRFSEMLRGPSEAEAATPDSVAPTRSRRTDPVDGKTVAKTGTPLVADVHAPDQPAADPTVISSLTETPEAITWAQPQSGVLVDGAPAGAAALPADILPGTLSAEPPTAAMAPALPRTTLHSGGAPIPAISAAGVLSGPPAQNPSAPVAPVAGPGATAPAVPAPPGAPTTAPAGSSEMAVAQPTVPAGAAAGASVPGRDISNPPALATATTARNKTQAALSAPSDQPASSGAPPPDRLTTGQAQASVLAEPSARNDRKDLPTAADLKTDAGLNRTAAVQPAAKPNVAPAATPPVIDKTAAAANTLATAVPSTVAEIADSAPSGSQADPVTAANSAPIGRMTVTAGPSTQVSQTPSAAQPAAEQVVLQVQRAIRDGVDRLTMQLKPASLGRVDIQMEVGHDGRLQAVISAERPETLHLLQRDARALTEALNDAGLQTDSGSLSFNLRGQSGEHGGGDGDAPPGSASNTGADAADDASAATTEITLTLGDGRVDIKV